MPTLLKVENQTINLDQVCEIYDYGNRMRVFYAVASSDLDGTRQLSYAEFYGEAAEALREWIAAHADDVDQDGKPRARRPAAKKGARRPAVKRPAAKRATRR